MKRPTEPRHEHQERKLLALLHKEPGESLDVFIARVVAATEDARETARPNTEGGDA